MPFGERGAPPMELRFEVIQDDAGQPRVYGVELPRGWPIGTPFPAEARRVLVPVNEVRFKADVGMADRLTLVALGCQVRLAGECGREPKPVELQGRGIYPLLEVIQDGEPRRDVESVMWVWDKTRQSKLLLGVRAKGVVEAAEEAAREGAN